MRIRGILAKGFLFALAVCLIPPTAVSAQMIISGSTCKVLNQKVVYTNITYTCIKSGKKLVWNNGLAVTKPNPTTPAPSVPIFYNPVIPQSNNPITWDNLNSRSADVAEQSWRYAQETIAKNSKLSIAHSKFIITRSPSLGKTFYADASNWMTRVNALYAHIPRPPMTYLFFTDPRDLDWTTKKSAEIAPYGDPKVAYAMYGIGIFSRTKDCTGPSPARAYSIPATSQHKFFAVVHGGTCIDGESNNRGAVTHEYTHQIQALIMPGGDHHVFEPCWMTEGQASWTSAAENDTFAGYVSDSHLTPYYLTQAGEDNTDPGIKIWTKQMVLKYFEDANVPSQCWKTNRYALSYSLGMATVEAMVAIAGAESHMAFAQRLAAGIEINTAFKAVYGVTWKEAAPILAEYVAKRVTDGIVVEQRAANMNRANLPATAKKYAASDTKNEYRISDEEGCSNPGEGTPGNVLSRATLQAQIDGEWIDVPSLDSGWTRHPYCLDPNLGLKNYKPWVVVNMDEGIALHWRYAGEINIFARDDRGFGISHTSIFNSATAQKILFTPSGKQILFI